MKQQYEDRLNKASENVLETMEDLLLWSKSQMNNFIPQYKIVKILPLLTQEIELFEEQVNEKELSINMHVSSQISQNTDENFIAVILRNLIQNSIKQCNHKDTITIYADESTITVTNPCGNKNAADLNEMLQQKEVSSKYSGFGLQIVKDLATRLGIKLYYRQEDVQKISAVINWV